MGILTVLPLWNLSTFLVLREYFLASERPFVASWREWNLRASALTFQVFLSCPKVGFPENLGAFFRGSPFAVAPLLCLQGKI